MQGFIIAIEVLDGAGKTIQTERLHHNLETQFPTSVYREPSDTTIGKFLREYLANATFHDPSVQAGLFLAAHAELMRLHVIPDLNAGKIGSWTASPPSPPPTSAPA